MRLSWSAVVTFLYPKILGLLGVLISLTLGAALLQIILVDKQNLALQLDGQLGDFDVNAVTSDHTITTTNTLIVSPHCLLTPTTNGSIRCLDQRSGAIKWQTWLADSLQFAPSYIEKYDLILLPEQYGGLTALDEKTGKTIWQYQGPSSFHWKQQLISVDQNYWIGLNTQNQTSVFDTKTGKLIWQTQIGLTPIEPKTQLFLHDNLLVVADSASMKLTGFNVMTGTQLWQQHNYTGDTNQSVEFAGDLLWYATNFYTWQGINKEHGNIQAKLTPPSGGQLTNAGTQLVFHTYTYQLFWFDAKSGQSLGTTLIPGKIQKIWWNQQLIVKFAAAPFAEKIASLDVAQHTILWQTDTLQVIRDVLPLSDKQILISSQNGWLTWLETETGKVLAQTFTQEIPLVVIKPFSETTGIWVLTTHHGTYSSFKELVDVWFFTEPGKLQFHFKNLPIVGATAVTTANRLWFVHQAQNILLSLSAVTTTPIFWNHQLPEKIWHSNPLMNFFEKLTIFLQPKHHTLLVEQNVSQTEKNCIATLTVTPQSSLIQNTLQEPGFNPWETVAVTAVLQHQNKTIATTKGYYAVPYQWRIHLLLPTLDEPEDLPVVVTFRLNDLELSQHLLVSVPAHCKANLLTLNKTGTQLQTSDTQPYWALGIQDAFLDENHNGNFLDDWVVPASAVPNNQEKFTQQGTETYLKTYAQSGFHLFRLSQDNFSFKNWLDFSNVGFRASLQAGLTTDQLLQQLRAQNYRVMFGLFGFAPEENKAAITTYLDYCIARFGPWIDIWELSNEAWPDDSWIAFVSTYLSTHDPYHHPITTSWDRSENSASNLVNLHYYRSEPLNELAGEFLSTLHAAQRANKPILLGEFGNSETSWDENSTTRFRLKTWLSAWYRIPTIVWNQTKQQLFNASNANLYLGPNERQTAGKLVGWLGKYENILLRPFVVKTNPPYYCAGLTDEATLMLLYCINSSDSAKSLTFDPQQILSAAGITVQPGKWHITWQDPASLQTLQQMTITTSKFDKIFSPAFWPDLVSEWRFEP